MQMEESEFQAIFVDVSKNILLLYFLIQPKDW